MSRRYAWQAGGWSRIKRRIAAARHPQRWHGWGKRRSYFEGWYYKLVVPEHDLAYAVTLHGK